MLLSEKRNANKQLANRGRSAGIRAASQCCARLLIGQFAANKHCVRASDIAKVQQDDTTCLANAIVLADLLQLVQHSLHQNRLLARK